MSPIFQIVLAVLLLVRSSLQKTTTIDLRDDIPTNGLWTVDCAFGYAGQLNDFSCEAGGVNIPPEQLEGEVGFWTKCGNRCQIIYQVQHNDTMYVARLYQSNLQTEVIYNGETTDFVSGEGWLNFSIPLVGKRQIGLSMNHYTPDFFTLLDKITIIDSE